MESSCVSFVLSRFYPAQLFFVPPFVPGYLFMLQNQTQDSMCSCWSRACHTWILLDVLSYTKWCSSLLVCMGAGNVKGL